MRSRQSGAGVALGVAILLVVVTGAEVRADEATVEAMTGLWLTEGGDAHIRIDACEEGLCGRIAWMSEPLDETGVKRRDRKNPDQARRDLPVEGMTILRIATTPDDKGVLRGGKIYDPKSGRMYRCTLRPDGDDALKMRGFWGISLLGRTTRWVRLADDADVLSDSMLSDGR